MIADTWDKGYGHFTTRQNIQFNWPKLPDVPAILSALADVGDARHPDRGNCVRNVTADHFAGAAADEIEDPRPVRRASAPVVHRPPGIPVPAAQVQDRHHRQRPMTAP